MQLSKYICVVDVESIGVNGEGFAAAAVVVDTETGEEVSSFLVWCEPDMASGFGRFEAVQEDRRWVESNVPWHTFGTVEPVARRNCQPYTPPRVRREMAEYWGLWHQKGATLWADVLWPVEARFFLSAFAENEDLRSASPYPFLDVAGVLLAAGMDPMATYDRLPTELPAHHCLADARQSARLLMEARQAILQRTEIR